MPRVKRGIAAHKRHKRVLKDAEGYWGARSRLIKTARDAVEKGWKYAYRDRKQRKREFRSLWIARINAAAREHGLSYSRLIHGLARGRRRRRPQEPRGRGGGRPEGASPTSPRSRSRKAPDGPGARPWRRRPTELADLEREARAAFAAAPSRPGADRGARALPRQEGRR